MSFETYTIENFTESLASKQAVPGGGGASALIGAVGMALGNMVGSLTAGKKKYAAVEEEILELMKEGEKLRTELLSLMDKDAEAFAPLAKAYGIPKEDPEKEQIMETALLTACEVPMDIMRTVCKALRVIEGFAAKGSAIAISDAGVGAVCCKAALKGASLNVFINTKSMKDRERAGELEKEAGELIDNYCRLADEIYETVIKRIR